MSPPDVLLFGAGGLAADVLDIAARVGGITIAGLVVDRDVDGAPGPRGLKIFHWEEVAALAGRYRALNAMGRPDRRAFIEKAEAAGFEFLTLVDPSAQIFPSAMIGGGTVINAGVIVAAGAEIGRQVYLNRAAAIGHHTVIDPFCSVQAGALIGSRGRLHEEVEVGIGATLVDRIHVGARTMIAAGALVTRDCPADSLMVGAPARRRER